MGRWEPNARGRLVQAAMELFVERGYEQATVAEIARRAGLTERTFFRHFTDKREVLFFGAGALQDLIVATVAAAPPEDCPIDVVAAAFEAAGEMFQENRDFSKQRQTVISANPELRERELIKLATLSAATAGALRERGVPAQVASLAAEAGTTVFKLAFERWIGEPDEAGEQAEPNLARLIRESLDELRVVTAGRA